MSDAKVKFKKKLLLNLGYIFPNKNYELIQSRLKKDKFLYYSNSTMKSGDWIGHSGLGGQFLAVNLKTRIVASYFSVIDTPSGTDEKYKADMINMLDEIVKIEYE